MRTKKRTEMIVMRFTLKEKERWTRMASELEMPASELMRLSMRAGLASIRRKFSEPSAKEA